MGIHDTVLLKTKCPYCGECEITDAQTKDLDGKFHIYEPGDKLPNRHIDKINKLKCITDCKSDICVEWQNKKDGYISGFGRMYEFTIDIDNNKITDRYIISNTYNI
jgi:hypothetical protein